MKSFLIPFALLFCDLAGAQNFLNGSFETNTAVFDQINLTNVQFNGFMANTTAFGTFGNLDIVTGGTYCGAPIFGSWYIALTGGGTDAVSMALSQPMIAGQSYTVTFWDRGCSAFSAGALPVVLGVANAAGTPGTTVYTGPTPTESIWLQRTATFVAPINANFITVSLGLTGFGGDVGYWVQVDNFEFVQNPCPLSVDLGADQTICEGASVTLDATLQGATYSWQDGSTNTTFTASTSGTYSVSATVGTCVYTDQVTVTVNPNPVVDLGPDQILCPGEFAFLNATTPGATYLWQNGTTAATINATTAGTYSVVVNVNGCTGTDSVVITSADFTPIDLGSNIQACMGDPVILAANNPNYTYMWQDGSTGATYAPVTSGIYSVSYTNGICTNTDQVQVTFNPYPVFSFAEDTLRVCFNTEQSLDASTPGATYLWHDGNMAATHPINGSGTYHVRVSIAGCAVSDTIQVLITPEEFVELSVSADCLEAGESVTITDVFSHADMLWNTGDSGPEITIDNEGLYIATLVLPCQTIVTQALVKSCPELHIHVPNCFTPNDDGLNDVLKPVVYINFPFDSYLFEVYGRFGEKVFTANSIDQVWDGGLQGSRYFVSNGVYNWRLVLSYGGNFVEKQGHITLIR